MLDAPLLPPASLDTRFKAGDDKPGFGDFAIAPFPKPARRSRVGVLSFALMVVIPTLVGTWYYHAFAARQFVTTAVIALRVGEEPDGAARAGAGSLVGSFGPPAGGPAVTQSYGLVNYVRSVPAIDDVIRSGVDVRAILASPLADPWARLPAGATQETLARYWQAMVTAEFEVTTGVVTVRTRAFTATDSLALSAAVLASSERLLNAVAERMHGDAVRYAERELTQAERRLVDARGALQEFRAASGVLDLGRALGGTAEIETRLRQDLLAAEGQAENLRAVVGPASPMHAAAAARSRGLRQQLAELERQTGRSSTERGGAAGAGIMSQYEALTAKVQLAERYHSQILDLLQQARINAVRQGTYLLTFVRPVAASDGIYPDPLTSSFVVFGCAFLAWAVSVLLCRAVLDHA